MEVYKELETPASKEFVKLLNSQLSKNKIEEGKVVDGKIAKITEKFIFLIFKKQALLDKFVVLIKIESSVFLRGDIFLL